MLVRGETTEDRIAKIAQGFGQGFQNFQQGQNQKLAQANQAEEIAVRKRAMGLDIEGKLSEQTGKNLVGSGIGQSYLTGDMASIGELMKNAPESRKAQLEAVDRTNKQEDRVTDTQYKQSITNKNNAEAARKSTTPPKEVLTYQQKLNMKAENDAKLRTQKITPDQRKVATFATRLEQSEKDFSTIKEAGFDRTSNRAWAQSFLMDEMKDGPLKQQDQAERNFVNALLRRESGSAIGKEEFTSAEKQYFPRKGDTHEVLAQKLKNRQIVLEGLKAEAGNGALGEIQQRMVGNENGQSPPVNNQGDDLRAELEQRRAAKAQQQAGG